MRCRRVPEDELEKVEYLVEGAMQEELFYLASVGLISRTKLVCRFV